MTRGPWPATIEAGWCGFIPYRMGVPLRLFPRGHPGGRCHSFAPRRSVPATAVATLRYRRAGPHPDAGISRLASERLLESADEVPGPAAAKDAHRRLLGRV